MLSLGQQFGSFEELKSTVENYEKTVFVQVWTSHSRTIENARKRGLEKCIKPELRYAEITYSCIHSGKYRSSSKGVRPNQSTYCQDCEAKIRLKASDNGQFLEVVFINEEHNHELNKNTFACLPRQRALDDSVRKMATKMLELRANKKLVQNELMKTTNTKVTLKDLHNLSYTPSTVEPVQSILQLLNEKEGSIVELLKTEDNTLLAIFYQDKEMQKAFDAYPEILFLDAIYKVNDRRMPLYVMLVEDGNGENEIVALFVLTVESAAILTQIASLFKYHNPSWAKTQVILTDKDMLEREAFGVEFPNAKLLICLFHTLRTFRREITPDKRGITQGQRDLCLEIIQRMAYAESEEKYMEYYKQLKDGPTSVVNYFNENWHNIRNQWVIVLQQKQGKTCGNRTNNRLESTNQKIMQVVRRHSNLRNMFEDLLKLVTSLRTERDCSAAVTQLKKPLNIQISCPAENEYLGLLTSYAFSKIKEKFQLLDKVEVLEENTEGITVKTTEGNLPVTPDKCACSFFVSMGLPCQHILQCRRIKDIELFSTNLVDQRWTKSYYLANSRLTHFDACADLEVAHCSTMSTLKTPPILSQHQKFRAASCLTTKLASLASEATKHYAHRMKLLENLVKLWEEGREAVIIGEEEINSEAIPNENQPGCSPQQEEEINNETIPNENQPGCSAQQDMGHTYNAFAPCVVRLNKPSMLDQDLVIRNDDGSSAFSREPFELSSQSSLKLPLKIPKRGRPKGSDRTVIGLPSKRTKKRPSPFNLKHPQDKDAIMLQWFVSSSDVKKAMNGTLLTESSVEQNCNKISAACLDEGVAVGRLRRYFDNDAWASVQHVINVKQKNIVWFCPCCSEPIADDKSICCNSCLELFHMGCVNLQSTPKNKYWFCKTC